MLLTLNRYRDFNFSKSCNSFPSRSPRGFSLPFPLSPTRSLHKHIDKADKIVS